MSTVAIAVIAYAGGALTMYLARRIGETSDRYPEVIVYVWTDQPQMEPEKWRVN